MGMVSMMICENSFHFYNDKSVLTYAEGISNYIEENFWNLLLSRDYKEEEMG